MKSPADDRALFENAPPVGLQRSIGLSRFVTLSPPRRALIAIAVGWAPLAILTLVQSAVTHAGEIPSFAYDAGVHARFLVAVPLLILAESLCAPWLSRIAGRFADDGLVRDGDCARFDAIIGSTRRLLNSGVAEAAAIVLAYLIVIVSVLDVPPGQMPMWHSAHPLTPRFSLAGWWHILISTPLLLLLIFGWLWRLALWTRLLWLISRLDLRLVASHPDRVAGLSFVGHSARLFAIVAMALAAIVAGRSANLVLANGTLPTVNLFFNIGILLAIAAVFILPLFVFTPVLMGIWRRGTRDYGALADRIGVVFEHKWLGAPEKINASVLERPDFSSANDVFALVSNVYAMRFVPINSQDLVAFAIAMALPFVPVVFLAVPGDKILDGIKGLLL